MELRKAIAEAKFKAPIEDIYSFFLNFKNYKEHTEYAKDIREIRSNEWEMDWKWWIVGYTSRSKLVDYKKNKYIEWKVTKDVKARGRWEFEELDENTTKVRLKLLYDPKGAEKANPLSFIPASVLVGLAKPILKRQISKILKRVAKEVEGKPREVDFAIKFGKTTKPDYFFQAIKDTADEIKEE